MSLYPSLAERVDDPEVPRIVLSIGSTAAMHFQTCSEKAGGSFALSQTRELLEGRHRLSGLQAVVER